MRLHRTLLSSVAVAAAWLATSPTSARIVEETIDLPVEVVDARGSTVRQPIKVTIFRDDARQKAPFLILNHGRASDPAKRAAVRPAQYGGNARWLVGKGFTVLMPVRIGYGETGGPDVENAGACNGRNYAPLYEAAARQSVAVIEHARKLPFIIPDKGIVMGQSYGGATAIALAAKDVPGVLAAVNFAGGGGGRPDTKPGEPCSVERLTQLFATYGATARIPTLWLYSVNDKYWGPTIPRSWHAAFTGHGGKGEFVELPPYQEDGHPSFTGNRAAWAPAVEAFLQSCCKSMLAPSK